MRERIASLEHQLDEERKANSEHRRLLAAALERIPPQLEAPQSPESPAPSHTVEGRLRFVMEDGEPGNRVEEVRRLAEEESGEGRSVWISMNWDLRMGVKEALQ